VDDLSNSIPGISDRIIIDPQVPVQARLS